MTRMVEETGKWEPTGLERFSHLEDKIYRFVEAFKAVRRENASLREEIQRHKSEIEAHRQAEDSRQENITQLQREREELRERVEKALALLAALEER